MKTIIPAVKGTRDFYPREMTIRQWIYRLIGSVSRSFGYEEYEAPFLERIDLYAAKSGEELVKEQAFVFPDRGGDLVTLRPELTLSLARMVAKRQNELVYPLRWWSFGPFWRYEKPQKGRSREFFQWNIDMIGVDSPEADAEIIAICATMIKIAGLKPDQVSIVINHRKLMEKKLNDLGLPADLNKKVFQLIDRKDKLPRDEWERQALDMGFTKVTLNGLIDLLTNKDLWKESPELCRIFNSLENYEINDYIKFDPRIIRGLDYYTGVVFEAWDIGGEGRAILGGGHYDNLVSDVGGEPLPGVGFAMGDVMMTLMLEKYGCIPAELFMNDAVLVTNFSEDLSGQSIKLAEELRAKGISTLIYPEFAKLQKQFKFADRVGIRIVIVIGPDESAQGLITIKDLKAHDQQTVEQYKAVEMIKQMLVIP